VSSLKKTPEDYTAETIQQVARIVSEMAGIQLGPKQYPMIENRLRTRMMRLNIPTFENYLHFLRQNSENESQALLSLLTTHHTYFFREFSHFEHLLNNGLPDAIAKARTRVDKTIRIWSAACSKGQEVYSLAMFFNFHLKSMAPDLRFHIWGTDIDPESVRHAENGVYKNEELKQAPAMYIQDNWIRGTGAVANFSKVKKELKLNCQFTTTNLFSSSSFLADKKFDFIFCRNVFIYFNSEQITKICKSFSNHLNPSGHLFLGVSESLQGLQLPLQLVGPSVYGHKGQTSPVPQFKPLEKRIQRGPLEILCIDDSGTILALLKKILVKETGFLVTATAKNGQEALDILKTQKFDAITLDLHMPVLDGVGFLQTYKKREIPILVVSSINRDDTTIAQKALSLGAADYVEKPSLENLAQAGNEIRGKIKTILQSSVLSHPTESGNSNDPTISSPTSSNTTLSKSSALKKIKVLIVDDSATIRNLLSKICHHDPIFEVVGMADRPSEVKDLIRKSKPDVITLDIHMPEMNGVELLEQIHPLFNIPTVMISSISKEEGPLVLRALEIGAVDYIQKPQMSNISESAEQIRNSLKMAASVKIQKRDKVKKNLVSKTIFDQRNLVVIGASTGGTEALKDILEGMPKNIPPILVVQHIPPVFSAALASRLNNLCPFEVREAKDGDEVLANQVLIAPGGQQMGVRLSHGRLFVTIKNDPPMNRHKPSVDYLFQSVSKLNLKNVVAGILTGMGADGAKQMKVLHDQGTKTIAQNQNTCVVYGMPREAIELGAADFILPLNEIAQKIIQICEQQNGQNPSANPLKKAS